MRERVLTKHGSWPWLQTAPGRDPDLVSTLLTEVYKPKWAKMCFPVLPNTTTINYKTTTGVMRSWGFRSHWDEWCFGYLWIPHDQRSHPSTGACNSGQQCRIHRMDGALMHRGRMYGAWSRQDETGRVRLGSKLFLFLHFKLVSHCHCFFFQPDARSVNFT